MGTTSDAGIITHSSNHNRRRLIPPVVPYLPPSSSAPPNLKVEFTFPLTPDHLLITLIQYNVMRATMTNIRILSLHNRTSDIPDECRASLALSLEQLFPHMVPSTLPPGLDYTPTQRAAAGKYETWFDNIPSPRLRDNFIRASLDAARTGFDPDEVWEDVIGGLYEGYMDTENKGFVAWSDPWSERGWEVSEGFVRKWGFLLEGCDEVMAATNRWRELRGEDRLIVEI